MAVADAAFGFASILDFPEPSIQTTHIGAIGLRFKSGLVTMR
jgi:hypothetical protein